MRPSEYLALRWSDIDWVQQTLAVSRTLAKGSRGWIFNDTKRARSRRVIKLQSWIIDLLRRRYEERDNSDLSSDEQVFRTAAGGPVNSDYLARCFKRVLLAAGLETMGLYDLRHTAASLALSAGVSPKVVSEQLGTPAAPLPWIPTRTFCRICRPKLPVRWKHCYFHRVA